MEITENYSWYRTGLVSVIKGSKKVTGINTEWLTAGIKQGDALIIDNRFYEIDKVTGSETLSLVTEYTGENAASLEYAIIQRARTVLLAELAVAIKQAVTYWNSREKLYEEKFKKLEEKVSASGKSDSGIGSETSTDTDSLAKFLGRLGLYLDEDGDLSQDDAHVTDSDSEDSGDSSGDPTETPPDVASEDDVGEMLDDVFSGDD